MRVFNALFATLTTLLLAATLVVSAGRFLGQRSDATTDVVRTEVPVALGPATPRLELEKPRPLTSPLATITPCLEPPTPLARLR